MKKLVICLFAMIFSLASYAENVAKDTTYFKCKNINYRKIRVTENGILKRYEYRNMDVKYKGDEATRVNHSPAGGHLQDIKDYYSHNDAKVQKEIMEILAQYIRDNFSYEEKKELLNSFKNRMGKGHLLCSIFVERNGTFPYMIWETFCDTYTDQDIANLDMIVRKKLVLQPSGLYSQRQRLSYFVTDVKGYIAFLEKDLAQNGRNY